jgi:hypothetical protein
MNKRAKRIIFFTAIALTLYVGSYFLISRVGLNYMKAAGSKLNGFLYVPCPVETIVKSPMLQKIHWFGYYFYYPIWRVDSSWGGPGVSYIPSALLARPPSGE